MKLKRLWGFLLVGILMFPLMTNALTIEEQIENQVLLTEAVIIGTTPNTYYNFEGISAKDTMEIIE